LRARTVLDCAVRADTLPGALLRTLVAQRLRQPSTRKVGGMSHTVLPRSLGSLHGARSGLMTAVVREEGTRTLVMLSGEADVSTTSVLSDVLAWMVARRTGDVVVDLGELEFLDSATVHVLAEGQQLLEHDGREMTFRSPSRLAVRVLDAFRLTDSIEARESTLS
jgi:anti-anti-sigma factor